MPAAETWSAAEAGAWFKTPTAEDDKYRRGVLGLRTGSAAYPGAAVLSAEAAWRTGVGLVRYTAPLDDREPAFGLPTPAAAVLAARPETVFADDSAASRSRCDAWLVGSGTDPATRSFAEGEAILALLQGTAPVVVDAGALGLVAVARPASPTIITPHRGEFSRLCLAVEIDHGTASPSELAAKLGVTVLLKGSITTIATPAGRVLSVGPATPWLATAGTGDVLAGVLGALVATHADTVRERPELLAELGASAAVLHDTAARVASRDETISITALDVAHALPAAFSVVR